jgi:type IV fimbrial biogenesis protein FimT
MDKSPGVRLKGRSLLIRRHRGFSLVEIMMSVVLLAIGTAIALPSFRDQVEKRQVTNGAEQIASFINSAQGASMKTSREVWVKWSRTANNDWCIGASVDAACDCNQVNSCLISGQEYVIDNSAAGDRDLLYSITGGGWDNAYGFDPVRGLMLDLNDAPVMRLQSNSDEFRLSIYVNSTGRVILCSSDAEHAVPGYDVCAPAAEVQMVEAES